MIEKRRALAFNLKSVHVGDGGETDQSNEQVASERIVNGNDDRHVGYGGQQASSASSANSANTGEIGELDEHKMEEWSGERGRQRACAVAGRGLGTDLSEDTGAGRKKRQVSF